MIHLIYPLQNPYPSSCHKQTEAVVFFKPTRWVASSQVLFHSRSCRLFIPFEDHFRTFAWKLEGSQKLGFSSATLPLLFTEEK